MPKRTRRQAATTRRHHRAPKPAVEQHDAPEPATTLTLDSYTPTGFADLGVPEEVDPDSVPRVHHTVRDPDQAIPVALAARTSAGGPGRDRADARIRGADARPGRTGRRATPAPGLVLVPTRELALQVSEVLAPVAIACGGGRAAVYGGASRQEQIAALNSGVEVVVATPLRLIDR